MVGRFDVSTTLDSNTICNFRDVTQLASMCKLKCGRLVREVADSCLQFWGGMGFTNEVLVSRLYRWYQCHTCVMSCDLISAFLGTWDWHPLVVEQMKLCWELFVKPWVSYQNLSNKRNNNNRLMGFWESEIFINLNIIIFKF